MLEIKVKIEAPEIANAITALAVAISATKVVSPAEKPAKGQKEVGQKKEAEKQLDLQPEQVENETPAAKEDKPETPTISLETVRAALAKLSQSGKQAQVKELISKFGAKKLTEVEPSKFADLLAAAEALA